METPEPEPRFSNPGAGANKWQIPSTDTHALIEYFFKFFIRIWILGKAPVVLGTGSGTEVVPNRSICKAGFDKFSSDFKIQKNSLYGKTFFVYVKIPSTKFKYFFVLLKE